MPKPLYNHNIFSKTSSWLFYFPPYKFCLHYMFLYILFKHFITIISTPQPAQRLKLYGTHRDLFKTYLTIQKSYGLHMVFSGYAGWGVTFVFQTFKIHFPQPYNIERVTLSYILNFIAMLTFLSFYVFFKIPNILNLFISPGVS